MKRAISLILLCLMQICMFAQDLKIVGSVHDSHGIAIAYASIALTAVESNSFVAGTISDDVGNFSFQGLSAGQYALSVSFVGYATLQKVIPLEANERVDCVLEEDVVSLDEVTVSTNRSNTVRQSAVAQTFMLSSHSMKQKDVMMALREIPALYVDPDTREITVANGSKPLILINGNRREGGLAGIAPEDILSVDVVNTASAEFMKEGYSSVVNVKVRRSDRRQTQVNGGVYSHPLLRFGIADFSVETGSATGSFYVTAQDFSFLNNKSDFKEKTTTSSYLREALYKRTAHYNDASLVIGGDRVWTEKDYTSYSLSFTHNVSPTTSSGESSMTSLEDLTQTTYLYYRKLHSRIGSGSANLYHKHTFGDASILDFLLQVSVNHGREELSQDETDEQYNLRREYDYRNDRQLWEFTPTYSLVLGGWATKLGLSSRYQYNQITQQSIQPVHFNHHEWDEYLFLSLNRQWNKLSASASIGMDEVLRNVDGYKDDFCNVRATLGLSYQLSQRQALNVQASRETKAPDVVELSPYNTSSDTLTVITGNPYLKPYHITNFRFAYTYAGAALYWEPFLSYRQINNAIVSIGQDYGDYYLTKPVNQGYSAYFSAGFNSRLTLGGWGYLGLRLAYNLTEFPEIHQRNTDWSGGLQGEFHHCNWSFNFYYGLPIHTFDKYKRTCSPRESNARLIYRLSEEWDVSVGMRFVGAQNRVRRWTDMPDYSYYYENAFTNRNNLVLFGFRYKMKTTNDLKRKPNKLENANKGFKLIKE